MVVGMFEKNVLNQLSMRQAVLAFLPIQVISSFTLAEDKIGYQEKIYIYNIMIIPYLFIHKM